MDLPRSSGLLLHLSSLPGRYGIGDFGDAAYRFADALHQTGQQVWQVLPLVPVGHGHSPYASPSTFAGNTYFLSPDGMRRDGLLTDDDLRDVPAFPSDHVDFARVLPFKEALLAKAFARFERGASTISPDAFAAFCREHAHWLDDYALFMALKEVHEGQRWTAWPRPLADRDPEALRAFKTDHAADVRRHQFGQFLFDRQWQALKRYCNDRQIRIFGDLPIYVAHDSADVWAHPDLFHLDARGNPTVVAGVPPDYFSATGQRWGNPLYRWEVMQERDFAWWAQRLRRVFALYDLVRLDHFRAFEAFWEIPAEEETAIHGRWVKAPGAALFKSMQRQP